jgi:hypothetical protein
MLKSLLARRDLSKTAKYLLILSDLISPSPAAKIKEVARNCGWAAGAKDEPGPYLRSAGAVNTSAGWEHTELSRAYLARQGLNDANQPLAPFAAKLRAEIDKISDPKRKRFFLEAIGCLNSKHYRAAIVLSWVGSLWLIYNKVFQCHLSDFVKEAQAKGYKNFQVKNVEDFGKIHKEKDFLEIAEKVGAISKTDRRQLGECLDRRNDAGHPNEFDPGEGVVAGHLEILLKHVFEKL